MMIIIISFVLMVVAMVFVFVLSMAILSQVTNNDLVNVV